MTNAAPRPSSSHCASCGSRLLPDSALVNWLWGKRCQECRARYCRTCVRRYVRTGNGHIGPTMLHEVAHSQLRDVDLEDRLVHAPLGLYDTSARFGTLRPPGAAFAVGGEVFANAREAAVEVLVRFALEPEALDRQLRRWVQRSAVRFGLAWLDLAEDVRSLGVAAVPSDFSSAYRCGYCGHRWGELAAASE